jgi:prepilin-type N-terminal cleavage/methylation domain-containing protein
MNRKGFTLTEILIVLVVAGILLALILPNTLKAIDQGNIRADESNVKTLQTAVFMCYTATKDWSVCNEQTELVAGNYIEKTVTSPYAGEDYAFTVVNDPVSNAPIGYKVGSTYQPKLIPAATTP